MFMALSVCALFVIRRKFLHAIALGVISFAPLALYGIISIMQGSYFLPNSLILKSSTSNITSLSDLFITSVVTGYHELLASGPLFVLVVLSLLLIAALYFQSRQLWTPTILLLSIFVSSSMLHLILASAGAYSSFRYDAYLLVLGLVVVTYGFTRLIDQTDQQRVVLSPFARYALIASLGLILLTPPFYRRGWVILADTSEATNNIYQQQFQMADFLSEYYMGRSVAANDIGLISYQADIRLLDLWGLASMQVAQAKRAGEYNTELIAKLAQEHNVEIALVYTSWYEPYGGLPKTWEKVGSWTVSHNLVLGDNTVTFYAVDKAEAQELCDNLTAFAGQLPAGVEATVGLVSEGTLSP
ncbi:MAG: hypothetical protein ABIQ44_14140 [Chloroflexia bacterium]